MPSDTSAAAGASGGARRGNGARCGAAVLIALFPAAPLFALDPEAAVVDYIRETWEVERGLPQNSILAIKQTRDGYLWLATQEGLARFDGVRFVLFDRRNTPGIRNNHIQTILETADGSLWVGTFGGGLSRFKDGAFEQWGEARGLGNGYVRSLYEDGEKRLWVGTNDGLYLLRGGRFAPFDSPELRNREVVSITGDRHQNLWVGTLGAGVCRVTAGQLRCFSKADGLPDDRVWSLLEDRKGRLWVGTGGGLAWMHEGEPVTADTRRFPNQIIHALQEDRDGNLWAGTRGGVVRMTDGAVESLTSAEGLPDNLVRALHEDREGNLWVGSYGGGLTRLKNRQIRVYTTADGLSENVARSIYEDARGDIWIGTYGGGLNRLRDGTFTSYRTADGLPHERVWSVLGGDQGVIWLGTFGGGLVKFDGRSFERLTAQDGLAGDEVRSLYRDRRDRLWVGTNDGVSVLDQAGTITTWRAGDGLWSGRVVAVLEDGRGDVWIGTSGGLNRIRGGTVERLSDVPGAINPAVYAFHLDADETLWIGTADGLQSHASGRFTTYRRHHGLADEAVFSILEDQNGYLWMSTLRGIVRVRKQELRDIAAGRAAFATPTRFGKADGMKSIECNGGFQPAGWRTSDGRLWFPTMRGVAIVDPRQVQMNRLRPPVVLEEAVADGKPLELLRRETGEIRLPVHTERIDFRFTALSFTAPDKVRFRYRLAGYDRQWIDAGPQRSASYMNLPPGRYRFEVMGSNNDGFWNERPRSIAFHLPPPLYRTWWFQGLLALVLLVGGAGAIRVRLRQIRRRERELATLVAERTREIEQSREAIEELAYTDTLTGLPNRLHFTQRLEDLVKSAALADLRFAVLFVDVDGFKKINDSLGHAVGDVLLCRMAERLRACLRASDTISRFGGDEFTILISGPDTAATVSRVAEKIIAVMRAPFTLHERELYATVSIGIALFPAHGRTAGALLQNADAAMYRAKELGRDTFQLYTAGLNDTSADRIKIDSALRGAADRGELFLEYQPVIDARTGTIVGAEALLRWQHPELGLLLPRDFIGIAETSGVIVPIGNWVVRTACAAARRWGDGRSVSINLSARELRQPQLCRDIAAILEQTGLEPRLLQIEITESSAIQNADETLQTLRGLSDLGVRIAIDDFGTGYSSLTHLKQFPIDFLKIDQSFIRDVTHTARDAALVRALIMMGHSLGLEVIGEGVETEAQADFLRDNECDFMQGHLVSTALRDVAFEALGSNGRVVAS